LRRTPTAKSEEPKGGTVTLQVAHISVHCTTRVNRYPRIREPKINGADPRMKSKNCIED